MTHGTTSGYRRGCRCDACRHAHASSRRQVYRLHATGLEPLGRLVPATETRRRLRLLLLEGYTQRELTVQLGGEAVCRLLRREQVTRRTHLKVLRLYRMTQE